MNTLPPPLLFALISCLTLCFALPIACGDDDDDECNYWEDGCGDEDSKEKTTLIQPILRLT